MIGFEKYSSTGNDFVIIDNRENSIGVNDHKLLATLCNRRTGVGADGVLFLMNDEKADFAMRYANADGAEVGMCGNGARAICHYYHFNILGGVGSGSYSFSAGNGIYHCQILEDDWVKIKMTEISELNEIDIAPFYNAKNSFYLSVGVPHCVFQVEDVKAIDLDKVALPIRNNPIFKNGVNINFIEVVADNIIKLRTFERGVEGETWSCGTGATASAISCQKFFGWSDRVDIEVVGGNLAIEFDKSHENVFLIGPTKNTFSGKFFTEKKVKSFK